MQPIANDSDTRYQIDIQPVSSGMPMASAPAASSDWVTSRILIAWCRATPSPARRLNSSIGRHWAASTAASAGAPPCGTCSASQNSAV